MDVVYYFQVVLLKKKHTAIYITEMNKYMIGCKTMDKIDLEIYYFTAHFVLVYSFIFEYVFESEKTKKPGLTNDHNNNCTYISRVNIKKVYIYIAYRLQIHHSSHIPYNYQFSKNKS